VVAVFTGNLDGAASRGIPPWARTALRMASVIFRAGEREAGREVAVEQRFGSRGGE
jgi:hypothetical protein